MYSLLSIIIDCFSSLIFIILGVILFTKKDSNIGMKLGLILLATYLLAVFSVVGMPSISYIRFDFELNLIPFMDSISSPISAILNIILFIPFGFSLPLLWPKRYKDWKSIVKSGVIFTLCIEFSQIFTLRLTDINDLIMNTVGAFLGFIFYQKILKESRWKDYFVVKSEKLTPFLIVIVTYTVMFFIGSLISNSIWELILLYII